MYVVTVEFMIRREQAGAFLQEMVANARASRERELGCLQFDVCVAPDDPSVVFLYERYADRAAFDAHLATPHFQAFDAAVGPWIERKVVHTYTRADPARG